MKKLNLVTAFVATVLLSQTANSADDSGEDAFANLHGNSGEVIGRVSIVSGFEGIVVSVEVAGLTPGKHGIHIHSVGHCTVESGFKSAKGHVNPEDEPHGLLHPDGPHEGDLPNLFVHDDGTAKAEFYSIAFKGNEGIKSLLDEDGSSFVIHAKADDHVTQPIGGAGARVACGVITPALD